MVQKILLAQNIVPFHGENVFFERELKAMEGFENKKNTYIKN